MVLYTCDRCNKEFNKKSNYITHINKKISCVKKESIDITCEYCGKELCNLRYLRNHIENKCLKGPNVKSIENAKMIAKLKKELNQKDEIIDYLTTTVSNNLKNNTNNTTNNSNINKTTNTNSNNTKNVNSNNTTNSHNKTKNITNNHFHINAFGQEETKYLSEKTMKWLLSKGHSSVNMYIELVHCNMKHMENCNIFNINERECKIIYFDGKNWVKSENANLIPDLIHKSYKELDGVFQDQTLKDKSTIYKVFGEFAIKYEEDDEKVIKGLNDDITGLLYTNRVMGKAIKKNTEERIKMEVNNKMKGAIINT